MAKTTKGPKKKSVKVQDLPATKNPKGGAYEFYVAVKGQKKGNIK